MEQGRPDSRSRDTHLVDLASGRSRRGPLKLLGQVVTRAAFDRKEREYEVMKGFRNAGRNDETCRPGVKSRDLPVSSRRDALERLRKSIDHDETEMALLTGEPGTGKTWLWRRLVQELPTNWRWLSMDMSEALDALDFLRLIGHGLGINAADRLGAARLDLARALQDDSSDGRSWLLVIENAQSTPAQVWNEIQAMVHAMEASAGFAAVILVGPTKLTRLLATRSLSSLATRIRTHVHLLSLDLDESLELVQARGGLESLDRALLEELHRDARGNPRLLLQLLRKGSWATAVPVTTSQPATLRRLPEPLVRPVVARSDVIAEPAPGEISATNQGVEVRPRGSAVTADESGPPAPPLVSSRPPLRVEEGLIEVGWGGNLEAEAVVSAGESIAPLVAAPPAAGESESPGEELIEEHGEELPSEEMIEDHYAALQAWTEWAKNRGRSSSPSATAASEQVERVQVSRATMVQAEGERYAVERFPAPGLRAEPQHEHAPYSQLFSRLRQSK
jgi:type II secretory pathway predicted ATPase ExeA